MSLRMSQIHLTSVAPSVVLRGGSTETEPSQHWTASSGPHHRSEEREERGVARRGGRLKFMSFCQVSIDVALNLEQRSGLRLATSRWPQRCRSDPS